MPEYYSREAYLLGACEAYLLSVAHHDYVIYRKLLKSLGYTEEELDQNIFARKGKVDD